MHHDGADHALFIRQPGPVFIRPKAGMHKTDDFRIGNRDDQASRVEIGLGEDQFIKFVATQSRGCSATELALVPKPKNVRGVCVDEMTIFNHGECLMDDPDQIEKRPSITARWSK